MKKKFRYIIIFAGAIGMIAITGCSTRTFNISCQPADALILKGTFYSKAPTEASIIGKTPIEQKITFIGRRDEYYFTATKRGFYQDTLIVNKDSGPGVHLQLSPIPDADTTTFNSNVLKSAQFIVLPITVDVVLHKGVGNLDKYERSEQQSIEVGCNLDKTMLKADSLDNNNILYSGVRTGEGLYEWIKTTKDFTAYLLSLNGNLLNYYPAPPFIDTLGLSKLKHFAPYVNNQTYMVYTYCKTIKPTSGRMIGNAVTMVAAATVNGYNTAIYGYSAVPYYNASTFAIDNSTLLVAFVISPVTGKVLLRKDAVVNYDITGEKAQEAIAGKLFTLLKED